MLTDCRHGTFLILRISLIGRLEFLQEARIVFREHAQVAHTILQVGDTLNTHTEGIAAVNARVDAALLQYVRVNHTAPQNLYPASVLTDSTAFAATNEARDVHLGTWLSEGEV